MIGDEGFKNICLKLLVLKSIFENVWFFYLCLMIKKIKNVCAQIPLNFKNIHNKYPQTANQEERWTCRTQTHKS